MLNYLHAHVSGGLKKLSRQSVFSLRTEEGSAKQYFQFYGFLSQQQNMMQVLEPLLLHLHTLHACITKLLRHPSVTSLSLVECVNLVIGLLLSEGGGALVLICP